MQEDILFISPNKYPLLGDRIQATFIDTMLIIVSMFIISALLERYENVPDWVRIIFLFAFGYCMNRFVQA